MNKPFKVLAVLKLEEYTIEAGTQQEAIEEYQEMLASGDIDEANGEYDFVAEEVKND